MPIHQFYTKIIGSDQQSEWHTGNLLTNQLTVSQLQTSQLVNWVIRGLINSLIADGLQITFGSII